LKNQAAPKALQRIKNKLLICLAQGVIKGPGKEGLTLVSTRDMSPAKKNVNQPPKRAATKQGKLSENRLTGVLGH